MKMWALLAVVPLSGVADAKWPAEYKTLMNASCLVRLLEGADVSRKHRRIVERTCSCITDETAKAISAERYVEIAAMSPEDAEDAWSEPSMATIGSMCADKHNLNSLPDIPAIQRDREITVAICALNLNDRSGEFMDGDTRIANTCICKVDAFTKLPALSDDDIERASDACEAKYLPKSK